MANIPLYRCITFYSLVDRYLGRFHFLAITNNAATNIRVQSFVKTWFQIGKGVCQGCILSPYLFNLYAEYITRNTGLEEAQAGIKIAQRNINNLRYADGSTLNAESEELKIFLMKMKEENEKLA